jgi:hypothetical protein
MNVRKYRRYVPGALGALLVVLGVGLIYWPAACILAGAALLYVDYRI